MRIEDLFERDMYLIGDSSVFQGNHGNISEHIYECDFYSRLSINKMQKFLNYFDLTQNYLNRSEIIFPEIVKKEVSEFIRIIEQKNLFFQVQIQKKGFKKGEREKKEVFDEISSKVSGLKSLLEERTFSLNPEEKRDSELIKELMGTYSDELLKYGRNEADEEIISDTILLSLTDNYPATIMTRDDDIHTTLHKFHKLLICDEFRRYNPEKFDLIAGRLCRNPITVFHHIDLPEIKEKYSSNFKIFYRSVKGLGIDYPEADIRKLCSETKKFYENIDLSYI